MGAINDRPPPAAYAEALRTIAELRSQRDQLLEALEATLDCDSCDAEGRLPTAQALIRRIREGE